jgi:hypothetical protein
MTVSALTMLSLQTIVLLVSKVKDEEVKANERSSSGRESSTGRKKGTITNKKLFLTSFTLGLCKYL